MISALLVIYIGGAPFSAEGAGEIPDFSALGRHPGVGRWSNFKINA